MNQKVKKHFRTSEIFVKFSYFLFNFVFKNETEPELSFRYENKQTLLQSHGLDINREIIAGKRAIECFKSITKREQNLWWISGNKRNDIDALK